LAVASRVAKRFPHYRVLVLEAGPDAPNENRINIPGMRGQGIASLYDWNLTSTPQPVLNNRQILQSRGKVLGGSSAINLFSWDRAASVEYDVWSSLGNPGWNWPTMLAMMTKAENFVQSPNYDGLAGLGVGGPVPVMVNDFIPPQQDRWIPTVMSLGIVNNLRSLAGNLLGVMFQPSNIRKSDRKRSYSAHNPGYPSIAGSNLEIRTNTRVAKINLSGDLSATGVTLEGGTVINARKEVILSAGSLQSPQLLELSGIGKPSVLQAAGIPVKLDLPGVGENLQDHVRIQNSYRLAPGFTSTDIFRFNATFAAEQLAIYQAGQRSMYWYTGSGYSFTNWQQTVGAHSHLVSLAQAAIANPLTTSPFEATRNQQMLEFITQQSNLVPEVEVIFSDGFTGVKGYPAVGTPLHGSSFFTLIGALMHPLSMGSVHITSSSITTPPAINPNYLRQEYDVQGLIEIAKFMRRLAFTDPLRQIWVDEYEPGLDVIPEVGATDAQWRAYVRSNSNTVFHPTGSCAMLPKSAGGVVDRNLKVHGVKALRVVDASIMPTLLSGHIQTAVYGVAERAARMIIDQYL
jgi:choline dehydrogenase-like flavoprotein